MSRIENKTENASETGKETTRQKKTTAAKKDAKKETRVYIGPSLRHVAVSGTIYNNGLPDALVKAKEKHPFMERLIVPIEELSDAKKEIENEGTALSVCYTKALSLYKEDKDE